MIHRMFTIYDEKAKAYLPPFFLPESGQAVRAFADCVNSDTHQFGKHPSDYTLFTLGGWDDTSAELNLLNRSLSLGNGVEFKQTIIKPETDNAGILQDDIETYLDDGTPVQPGPEGGNSA